MNQLEQTLTSLEVAEMVGKDHKHLLEDIRRYSKQLGETNIRLSDFFTESTYKNSQNKVQPCYNVTKKGCEFISHKLTGIKGTEFTAKYINRFHDMEQVINKPLTQQEIMRIQLGMLDDVSERVSKIEDTMNIDYGQQQVLNDLVAKVVINALGGKESNAYAEIGKKVFAECSRDYKHYFKVNARANTPRMKFEDAKTYIENWEPCSNTKMDIRDCNAQVNLV